MGSVISSIFGGKPSIPTIAAPPPAPAPPPEPVVDSGEDTEAKRREQEKLQQRSGLYERITSGPAGVEETPALGRTILTGSLLKTKLG